MLTFLYWCRSGVDLSSEKEAAFRMFEEIRCQPHAPLPPLSHSTCDPSDPSTGVVKGKTRAGAKATAATAAAAASAAFPQTRTPRRTVPGKGVVVVAAAAVGGSTVTTSRSGGEDLEGEVLMSTEPRSLRLLRGDQLAWSRSRRKNQKLLVKRWCHRQ